MVIRRILQSIKKTMLKSEQKNNKLEGTIKFFDRKKRFGFIVAGKHEYFFHSTATQAKDFKSLQEGTPVSFVIIQGKKGPQADKVKVITTAQRSR